MNCTLLFPADFTGPSTARLAGDRLAHLPSAGALKAGDRLAVGVLNGSLGSAVVSDRDDSSVTLLVTLDRQPPPPLPVTLIAALPRPKSMRKVVHCAAAMGVKRIVLLETWRVDKSYWQTPWLENAYLRELMVLALEQAVDTRLPDVMLRRRFKPFVEDELPAIAAGATCLAAHPSAAQWCPYHVPGPAALAVGPEGGFTDYEIRMLAGRGFRPVTLGERMLRVDEAVPALLGRVG